MTFWGSSFGFPSLNEVVRTKADIITLESHLEQALERARLAQHQVAVATSRLNWARAFIAPIRKLNFDVLSLIFEIAANNDLKAPLRIAGVSHLWRGVIQRTPRVWSVLDRRRIKDVGSALYLNHSLPSRLHVHETHEANFSHLAQMAHKVECLTATVIYDTPTPIVFPNLKRLVAGRGYICHANLATINTSRFPNLRHLNLDTTFHRNSAITGFPQLETLAIVLHAAIPWFDIINACKNSLISLRPTIVTLNVFGDDNSLHLPRLRYLEIVTRRKISRWEIEIEAPALETYIERSECGWFSGHFHETLDSVKNLRLSYLPELENMKQLEILQLSLMEYVVEEFIEKVTNGPWSLPNLRILEFRGIGILTQEYKGPGLCDIAMDWYWEFLCGRLVQPPRFACGWSAKMPGANAFEV